MPTLRRVNKANLKYTREPTANSTATVRHYILRSYGFKISDASATIVPQHPHPNRYRVRKKIENDLKAVHSGDESESKLLTLNVGTITLILKKSIYAWVPWRRKTTGKWIDSLGDSLAHRQCSKFRVDGSFHGHLVSRHPHSPLWFERRKRKKNGWLFPFGVAFLAPLVACRAHVSESPTWKKTLIASGTRSPILNAMTLLVVRASKLH